MQFTLLSSLAYNVNYLKQALLLCFSPAETDQSTQELFTTKIPRTTESAKTTRGNTIFPPLYSNFFLSF